MNLINQLHNLGFSGTLYFHVLGEPLLHPSVFKITDHAADAGMRPVIFTNGGSLTDTNIHRILASKTSEIVISMQTINQESYERLRKTPFGWETYLHRIQTALGAANSRSNENDCIFRVSIGLKKADPEHPEDVFFLEHESLSHVKQSIAEIFSAVPRADLESAFSELDTHGLVGMGTLHVTDMLHLSVKPMGNWRRAWRDKPVTEGRCAFFGTEMAALSNGDITFCHIDYDGRTAIGNITEKPLAEIIDTPEVMRMVEEFTAGRAIARGCERCKGVKDTPLGLGGIPCRGLQ